MTTSGITAWPLTARDLVTTALQEAGIIAGGEEPEAAELRDCLTRLNAMLKSWSVKGVLHREAEEEVSTAGGSATVTLPASIGEVIGARVAVSPSYHRPLYRWERGEYQQLPNRASVGQPTAFYHDKAAGSLILWPVAATATDLILDVLRSPETVTEASQTVDIPEQYQEAVYANLAVRCAGLFGSAPSQELASRAALLERQMFDAERPASYQMWADA